MSAKRKSSPSIPIQSLWLNEEFEKLHKEHAVILGKLDDIERLIKAPVVTGGTIGSELEMAIKTVSKTAKIVDDKVPDVNVPPAPTTT